MVEMIESMLSDDHGISEEAYKHLYKLVHSGMFEQNELEKLFEMLDKVEATDGRFYLPE